MKTIEELIDLARDKKDLTKDEIFTVVNELYMFIHETPKETYRIAKDFCKDLKINSFEDKMNWFKIHRITHDVINDKEFQRRLKTPGKWEFVDGETIERKDYNAN